MKISRVAKVPLLVVLLAIGLSPVRPAVAGCGCMDVALVIDDTGSMFGAIGDVQSSLLQIINVAEYVSGADLRIGLITFPNDNVVINVPFTSSVTDVITAVQGLVASGGNGEPESSDESLQYAITGAADPSCSVVGQPLGSFRSGCVKIAVLITDAHPGECSDTFTPGVSDVHAHQVALDALNAGVKIASVYVPDTASGGEHADIKAIMEDYATTSGGVFIESGPNGEGTGDGIANAIATCGVPPTQWATRNSRFWFTHGFYLTSSGSNCVSLLDGILINGGIIDLGFLNLPTANRNADNVINSYDTLIEALSFYWRNAGVTGEAGGTQNQKARGSSVCKARKQMATELIAATANIRLLFANPTNSFYFNGVTITNFPADLLAEARTTMNGFDPVAMASMTALLRKFNSSGQTNNYPSGWTECSPQKSSQLRSISLDPTMQSTCPGVNDSCAAAAVVVFPNSTNKFASAIYSQSVNLNAYTNNMPAPTCGSGGRDAVWEIRPDVGTTNRQFTVSSAGSNFSTMLTVWSGGCGSAASGGSNTLTQVTCAVNSIGLQGASLTFNTDGINSFFIVGEGIGGQYGNLKLRITSP
ncbi:MAG TPA: vWA domain-containing protein [Verrucomicrobiae bacterium]|nr:vWA domain-containing protein [Verrucomicrobiae bacterium]